MGKIIETKKLDYSSIEEIEIFCNEKKFKKQKNTYKTKCPFHEEKTPSFHISPKLGIFHCFGCGKSGYTSLLPVLFN